MEKFNVFIKNYDDEEDVKLVTKDTVSYRNAVAIEINLSNDYYTEIKEA